MPADAGPEVSSARALSPEQGDASALALLDRELDAGEAIAGGRVDPQDGMAMGRAPLREQEPHIAAVAEGQEVDAVRLVAQEAAGPDVEAFLVGLDGLAHERVH